VIVGPEEADSDGLAWAAGRSEAFIRVLDERRKVRPRPARL